MLDHTFNKIMVVLVLAIFLSTGLPLTQAISAADTEKQEIPPLFDLSNPPSGTMTMEQLLEIAPASKESASKENCEIIVDAFDGSVIHNAVKNEMADPEQRPINEITGQMQTLQNPQPIGAIISIDDDMVEYYWNAVGGPITWDLVCDWATYILEGGDDYLESNFGIDFQPHTFVYWNTPDYQTYEELLLTVYGIDPTGIGADVMIVMSAQFGGYIGGSEVRGAAIHEGRHFIMNVDNTTPAAHVFQHEASHLFDCVDHGSSACIMNYDYTYTTRAYCTDCTNEINAHRFRFD
jgi:hypothetical protein